MEGKKKSNGIITIRLNENDLRQLDEHAKEKGLNRSSYIKNAIKSSYDATYASCSESKITDKRKALINILDIKKILLKKKGRIDTNTMNEIEGRLQDLWDSLN